MKLAPRDRAFARLLVATVLRRLGQIDDILTQLVQRPPEGKDAYVQQILRVAAAQLLFLDTPPHGAVDEAVKMTRGPGMKAMVNAVLRKISTQRHALLRVQDGERLNLPDWLWRSWCEAYGEANTRAISRAHTFEPPLDITMRDSATTPIWAERLEGRCTSQWLRPPRQAKACADNGRFRPRCLVGAGRRRNIPGSAAG